MWGLALYDEKLSSSLESLSDFSSFSNEIVMNKCVLKLFLKIQPPFLLKIIVTLVLSRPFQYVISEARDHEVCNYLQLFSLEQSWRF